MKRHKVKVVLDPAVWTKVVDDLRRELAEARSVANGVMRVRADMEEMRKQLAEARAWRQTT